MLMVSITKKEEEMVYGTHQSRRSAGEYHGNTFADLKDVVIETTERLKLHQAEFDHIIVTGISGLVVGAPVALALEKNLIVVRKRGEDCHDGYSHPGMSLVKDGDRILFLDDFVSSGNTRHNCQEALQEHEVNCRIVAQFEYQDAYYRLVDEKGHHVPS